MPVKNTVAVERRTDLASLFCMIGRHGPAVALAVIAMVSVVAGFIFYRNVRGKRRKATAGEAAAAGAGAERDASMIGTDEEPELSESTDASDEGSSYTKVDPDLIQSGPRIRHRRSPSAEKPPTFCPPQMETSVVQDCSGVAEPYEEEDIQALQGYFTPVTAVGVKDGDDCCPSLTDDTAPNVEADCNVESCLEPEPVYEETHTDDEKVFQAKCEEDRNTVVHEDVSQGKSSEEENLQCTSDSPLCSEQDIPMSETTDVTLQGLDATPDTSSHLEKQIVQTEEDISDPQTSQVEEVLPCVSSSPVCFEQDHDVSETSDDKLRGSGATPDTNGQSDEPVDAEDCRNTEVENLCASDGPLCFKQDSQISENHKGQDGEVTPNAISGLKEPIIDKQVSNGKINREENSQCASNSPVCLDQDVHFGENGDDHKLQVGEIVLGPDGNLEEPVNRLEDEPVSRICEKEVELEENCQAECPDVSKNNLFEDEVEVMPECSDDLMFAQQLGYLTSKQENLLCSQQDWCRATNVLLSSQEEDRFQTTEVTEEIRGEDNLHNLAEVTLDVGPPEIDEHQLQDEHKEDNGFAVSEGEVVGSCGDECEKEILNSVPCLNQSAESAKEDEVSDAKVEASDLVYLSDLPSDDQQAQSEEGTDAVAPVLVVVEQNVADKLCLQEEIASEKNESGHVLVLAEESGEHLEVSCYKDQQSDCTESREMFDGTGNPSTDAPVCDEASFSSSVVSRPDTSASSQSDQIQNVSAFAEVSSGVTSDTAVCSESHMSLSLSESQLTQSLSGFGEESGISSMAVSPDLSDALDEFGTTPEHVLTSAVDCHPYSEEQAESQLIFTHDAAVFFNEALVGVAPQSCQTPLQQTSHDWAMDRSVAVNEDIFGNDVEDGYHSTMGQLIAANTMTLTDDITKKACNDVPVLVVQIDGKEGTERMEGAEEFEKTEISIMEATMDNNEWITDGNYQVLPWMNLSTSSFPQIPSKPDPSPDSHPFSLTDDTSIDTDIPPSIEASQTDALSLEESFDGSKKVLAVQPMPQNVNVTFRIHYLTQAPYQKLAVTGNHEELGSWKEFILLDEAKDGHWSTVVGLPAESHVEWKFVVLDKGGVCRWEECGNRLLETGYGEDLIVRKWWGFL